MTAATQPAARPRCAAQTAWRWDPAVGFVAVRCWQTVGLRTVGRFAYCCAPGHREQVAGLSRRAAG